MAIRDLIKNEQARRAYDSFVDGMQSAYSVGRDDTQKMFYRMRDLEGKSAEAPRMTTLLNTHPGIAILQQSMGLLPEGSPKLRAMQERDIALSGSLPRKIGQFIGTAGGDLTQDTSRGIYWLLNALQATGEVIGESTIGRAAPSLYGKHNVLGPDGASLNMKSRKDRELSEKLGYTQQIDGKTQGKRGYSIDGDGILQQVNYPQGRLQSLAIPGGVAINSGLGLLTPFGGAEGYEAASPSEEDPSKTANVLEEVALKYIMGRTGNLLPYDEFVKVRPDVSKAEYNKYKAFKYDKSTDLDPRDGDLGVLGGALKYTNEGIHGPEVQMLGRSLPLTTGIIPFATAVAGTALGARRGHKQFLKDPSKRTAVRDGFVGGIAGLTAGQVAGNLIEAERRRRNEEENKNLYGYNL